MKIELVKEEKFGDQDWFCVKVDGACKAYEHSEEKANQIYQMLIDNPDLLEKKETILKSVEIVVSLEDTKTQ